MYELFVFLKGGDVTHAKTSAFRFAKILKITDISKFLQYISGQTHLKLYLIAFALTWR